MITFVNVANILVRENSVFGNVIRHYAFKSDLKIKWVRPLKIPCFLPEKSGDLEGVPSVDTKQPILEFRNSEELETANEHVRKLFSLEFSPLKYTRKVYFHELVNQVQRHNFDHSTIEAKIAKWTGRIRAWQECMERYPRNVRLKVKLKELIDKRKKHLKYLRRWDYKKFEWLLEVLNIVYKPPPNEFHWITRKESLVKLTNKYCENIKQQRLEVYRLQLESEHPAFLEEKIRALHFIRDEQKECGVEVTISEEEIENVRVQLQNLNNKMKETDE
ncbi:small ribosomal subunit protein uS15m [Cylas formicarius]|uniref:small ribosomal subunit protein uS15m n=1 Tax=Cylas formicarius TaxID=197179 RepID=UPI0029585EA9|nr:small ribosomal subunit protein uS15m [Cylas formicarius]